MLLGENGAGKSTLMKILSGAYRKDAARSAFAIGRWRSPARATRSSSASASSTRSSISFRSCRSPRTSSSAPRRRGVPGVIDWRQLTDLTTALLADLGMDLDAGHAAVTGSAWPQRQMVEIAKALRDPSASILVMDEPTSALTSREVDQLFALIERLVARGVAHRLHHPSARRGVSHRPARHGAARRRHVATTLLSEVTVAELVRLMANRDLGEHFPQASRARRARSCCASSGVGRTRRAERHQLHAARRRNLGVAGLLGAGRSELARVLAGADRADTRPHLCRRRSGGLPHAGRRDRATASACCRRIARPRAWSPA